MPVSFGREKAVRHGYAPERGSLVPYRHCNNDPAVDLFDGPTVPRSGDVRTRDLGFVVNDDGGIGAELGSAFAQGFFNLGCAHFLIRRFSANLPEANMRASRLRAQDLDISWVGWREGWTADLLRARGGNGLAARYHRKDGDAEA